MVGDSLQQEKKMEGQVEVLQRIVELSAASDSRMSQQANLHKKYDISLTLKIKGQFGLMEKA